MASGAAWGGSALSARSGHPARPAFDAPSVVRTVLNTLNGLFPELGLTEASFAGLDFSAISPDETLQFVLSNGTTVNLRVGGAAATKAAAVPRPRHKSHAEIAAAVLEARPDLRERLRFSHDSPTSTRYTLYYCDPATSVWRQLDKAAAGELVVELCRDAPGLSAADRRYVAGRNARSYMVVGIGVKVMHDGFRDELDADLDLLATADGVFATPSGSRPAFRALRPEDRVSTTTGWAYSPGEGVGDAAASAASDAGRAEARAELDAFLARTLPVAEERRVVLAYFASLLSGRRTSKKVLVLSDARSGRSGKSALVALMAAFFGGYAAEGSRYVSMTRSKALRDRNSPDSDTKAFRGKRLVVADALGKGTELDLSLLQQLAGGSHVRVGGRCAGSRDTFEFVWQAGIVLVFGHGNSPRYDPGDAAFARRLLVVPMRAAFVDGPAASDASDEWTHGADPDSRARFPRWMSALADVLVEHYNLP